MVGIAVFVAAVWIVTSIASLDRSETQVVPGGLTTGPAETGPAETGPAGPPDAVWDGYGIPPEGTRLSTPVEGELIKEYPGYHASTYVYADGRVIWYEGGAPSSGNGHIYERRLTPEGVDLVRSGARLDNHPLDDLPASAWTDAEQRLYAPQAYTVCFWKMGAGLDPSDLMEILPPPAKTLLQQWDLDTSSGCLEVATEQARALDETLSQAGLMPAPAHWAVAATAWFLRDNRGARASLIPLLPDGGNLPLMG